MRMSATSGINRGNDRCEQYLFISRCRIREIWFRVTWSTCFRLFCISELIANRNRTVISFSTIQILWSHTFSHIKLFKLTLLCFLQTSVFSMQCTLCPTAMAPCLHHYGIPLFSVLLSLSVWVDWKCSIFQVGLQSGKAPFHRPE